jgi:hypothetical protein
MASPNETAFPHLQGERVMKHIEPPSPDRCSKPPLFMIGKDSEGRWVVQDEQGLCGGLFVDRAQALKFAMFENGHRPQAVVMIPGVFELNMTATPRRLLSNDNAIHKRQIV